MLDGGNWSRSTNVIASIVFVLSALLAAGVFAGAGFLLGWWLT